MRVGTLTLVSAEQVRLLGCLLSAYAHSDGKKPHQCLSFNVEQSALQQGRHSGNLVPFCSDAVPFLVRCGSLVRDSACFCSAPGGCVFPCCWSVLARCLVASDLLHPWYFAFTPKSSLLVQTRAKSCTISGDTRERFWYWLGNGDMLVWPLTEISLRWKRWVEVRWLLSLVSLKRLLYGALFLLNI